LERYARTLANIAPFLTSKDAKIVDVGCAKGGFLSFLKTNGYTNLHGVDINPSCVDYIQNELGIPASVGLVHELPLAGRQAEVIIYSHVLEHIYDLYAALGQAEKVLKDDGLLYVELPDALQYGRYPVSDFYWFGLREHINHFDAVHLDYLLKNSGFSVIAQGDMPMPIAPGVENQLIYWAGRKNGFADFRKPCEFHNALREAVQEYLSAENQRLITRRRQIKAMAQTGRPVYVWGIGLEFFAFSTLAGLNNCNLQGLVDKNPGKQGKTVNGLSIQGLDALSHASPDTIIAITSALHKDAMFDYLHQINFRGEVVVLA
ncbi:MAG: class I SAM-dependent methyltransferase, partial [Deltaproteobacteria bacterium]|nr:class I SAM-dependent methyltransferase [Deltaproteobacteria bacterium]